MRGRDLTPSGDWTHGTAPVNGVDMHFVREGQGAPVILLHGWPEFWWGWHRNIPSLAQHFDVVAPDFRGFGDTKETSDIAAGPEQHAADILALADHLGFQTFGIAAHDVGGSVAQAIARQAPERLKGLFVFNAPYPGIGTRWADADQISEIWYQSFNQKHWAAELIGHTRETCEIYFGNILRHWAYGTDAFEGQIEHFIDNFMKPGNIAGGFAWYRATHASRMDLVRNGAPELPKIQVPTRVYWGRHDPVIRSSWSDRVHDFFANAVVEIAEGAGHFVHFEQPDAANARMIEFFKSVT